MPRSTVSATGRTRHTALGSRFDDAIVLGGNVPLTLLDKIIGNHIASSGA